MIKSLESRSEIFGSPNFELCPYAFKIVETELDLLVNNGKFFHPKYTHQVFHKDETIKGMKDLNVTLYLTPTTLKPYIYWCCSDYG